MRLFFQLYPIAIVVFFAVDIVWLGVVAKRFYQSQIGHLLKENVNWIAAFVFYFIFVAGVVFFAIMPAWRDESALMAFALGGFFGFIAYSTYDLTNLATTKDWPLSVTIVDLLWGSFLGGATSLLTYLIFTVLQ